MYNTMFLKRSALPYSLFLYHPSMDENTDPEVYVMMVAWYGITSTGAQAGYAIEKIVQDLGSDFPAAVDVLLNDRYVDDVYSGQIAQMEELLSFGGFKLKYMVRLAERLRKK